MSKSILVRICATFLLLISFQASALVVNGTHYKQYPGAGTTCPDGRKVFVYSGVRYCRAYKANLTWAIPSTRANGTALPASELAGYEVYWTRESDKAKGTLKVYKGYISTTSLEVYTPGTYYFAVSAIDTKGQKSALSKVVQAALGS